MNNFRIIEIKQDIQSTRNNIKYCISAIKSGRLELWEKKEYKQVIQEFLKNINSLKINLVNIREIY